MLRNYVLVAIRNLTKHRFFSIINIFGLAISMSVCLGLIMLVADQFEYDRHNSKRDRIYRITTDYVNSDGSSAINPYATTPLPVGPALVNEFTGVEKSVRIRRGFGNGWIEFDQDLSIPLGGFFVDPEMLDVFELELQYGDPSTALRDPYSVVLTRKAADKLFKKENPLGEVIKVGKVGDYTVTGILKEKPVKSHIVYEALASFSTIESLQASNTFAESDNGWGNFTAGWVYILRNPDATIDQLQSNLDELAKIHRPDNGTSNEQRSYKFGLQPITAITPGPFINNPIGPFMPMLFVYFFGGLALIVMITSCFNYTNLSIARSLSRAKEIGVRKVNGANRFQIFTQFITEAVILSLVALGCALLLLIIVKPFLLNLTFARILKWDLQISTEVYIAFIAFSLFVGLMAGFFPAVFLSRFEPIRVLKKIGSVKLFSRLTLRKSLLVFQFSLSLIFIISVLVVHNQLALFMHKDHGFDMSNKFVVKLNSTSYQNLKRELEQYSTIINAAGASHLPAAGMVRADGYKRNLADTDFITLDYYDVDENYLDNMGIELVAGKNFDASAGERNRNRLLLNEQALKKLAISNPHDAIGEIIFDADSSEYSIIGVVRDYNHEILISQIGPMALRYRPESFSVVQVQFAGDRVRAGADIEKAWTKVNPAQKIEYNDFEAEVRGFYKTVFGDFEVIIGVISFMAIAISCLGLLGMATYAIETRMKEIAIRKALGSTDRALIMLLSKGFLVLLLIAIAVAAPAAWFINNLWLELIAYRTEVSFGVIGLAAMVVLTLAIVTIGSQTLRATYSSPVTNLKNE